MLCTTQRSVVVNITAFYARTAFNGFSTAAVVTPYCILRTYMFQLRPHVLMWYHPHVQL